MKGMSCGLVAAVLVLGLVGCGDDDGATDTGMPDTGTTDTGTGDTSVDSGTDGGDGGDGGTLGALGAECQTDDECESGECVNPLSRVDLGTGFCSHTCAEDTECSDLPDDGYTYGCVNESLRDTRCHRLCDNGFGCPEDGFCIDEFNFEAGTADICIDVSNDGCRSNGDCTDPERCSFFTDRERGHQVCFAARNNDLTPIPYRTVGDECDPTAGNQPCSRASDCPSGYLCQDDFNGNRVCQAPNDERCHLLCVIPGVCSGLCDTDDDCPTDMRCSRSEFSYLQNTPGAFDDGYVEAGFCTYAAGSLTACDSANDCAATGAAGAEEVCWPAPDEAGAPNTVCVTPPDGYGRQGDACGDDPTTDGVRETRFCAGGNCLNRQCGEPCATADDCPSGLACLEQYISSVLTVGFCADYRACTDDAGCEAGEICQGLFGTSTGFQRGCTTPSGALTAGETCDSSAPAGFEDFADTCETFCFNTGEGAADGKCSELCEVDADCPSADWICGRINQTINNAGTFPDRTDDVNGNLDACQYIPGSRDTCTVNDDCPSGERCIDYTDASDATVRVCVTAVAGGADTGESCSETDPCAGRVCNPRWDDPSESFCSEFCTMDSDCPTGFACRNTITDNFAFSGATCMDPNDPRGTPL